MLVEKEVIRPGTYWYQDQASGLPRKLVVTPDLTRYWHEQGNAMLATGLTVPVPYEHDFSAHPMTPKDMLLNNAGEIREYRLRDNTLFSVIDVKDDAVKDKIGKSVRWTSPWINSFTDGNGKRWNNVISHLALTLRPRVVNQEQFRSVAAALSMASEATVDISADGTANGSGFVLSTAARLCRTKADKRVRPLYPVAFSLSSGIALAEDDDMGDEGDELEDMDGSDMEADVAPTAAPAAPPPVPPAPPAPGDVSMEELLVDLLGALGVQVQHADGADFKRSLYNAVMTEIHSLTAGAKGDGQMNRTNPPGQPPNNPVNRPPGPQQQNPLIPPIQQEQQPMYMSLEDINKLDEPLRSVALSMYNETVKAHAKAEATEKMLKNIRDAKLKDANQARAKRVGLLCRLSPRLKPDLDAMLALPGMALSIGDGGDIVDPMAPTLTVLEKGISDLPRLLTADTFSITEHPQPSDADMLTEEKSNEISDSLVRMMGYAPESR